MRSPGHAAIGHVRYSTAGSSTIKNAQPFVVEYSKGSLAIAHNGNLTNAKIISDELQNYGSIFQSTMDTEVIVHLIALSHENLTLDRLISGLRRVEGSYSLLVLTDKEMIAVRDPLRLQAPRPRHAEGRICSVQRDVRFRPHRGGVHARDRAGRGRPLLERRRRILFPLQEGRAAPLHLRVHLFRQARQQHIRPDSLQREKGLRAGSLPARAASRPTWSSLYPTPA